MKQALRFCSTPKGNQGELTREFEEFERKFRLIEEFNNKENTDDSQEKNKSKFFPDQDNNRELNTFFEKL